MDPGDGNALRLECPRCGHFEEDDYEVIHHGNAVDWRCDCCERLFSVLLIECERCGCERVQIALTDAEQANPTDIPCQCCGRPSQSHEDLTESDEAL